MRGNAPCIHVDGEFCAKCWPPKSKDTNKVISIWLHLSKVDDRIYVAIDSRTTDLKDFGISHEMYDRLGHEIEDIFNKVILNKSFK